MATTNPSNSGSGRFPLWGKIALGVFVALLLIALALPYFLNVDRYRDTISEAIAKQTGRKVTIGKLGARLLPGAALTVDGLHIGNPQGFPDGDLLSADEIRVNVALLPLLSRTVHVNSVDLVRPKLSLVTDSNGKDNYTFAPSAPAASAPPASPAGSSSVALDEIESLNLTDAEVMVGDVVRAAVLPSADVKGINISLHNFVVTPMRVHDWQAESKLTGVTLMLGGWSAPVAFQSGQVTLSGGKMDAQFVADLAKASDIKGTLSIADVEHPQVNFELSASQLDIDKLIAAAGGGSSSTPAPAAQAKAKSAPAPPDPARWWRRATSTSRKSRRDPTPSDRRTSRCACTRIARSCSRSPSACTEERCKFPRESTAPPIHRDSPPTCRCAIWTSPKCSMSRPRRAEKWAAPANSICNFSAV